MNGTGRGLVMVQRTAPDWEALLREHEPRGRAFCRRILGSADLADDVWQEACLRICQARERYEETARFSTFLYRVLSNVCMNLIRDRCKSRNVEQPAGDRQFHAPGQRSGADALVASEEFEALRRALDALPTPQRVALVLKVCEGQSHAEIGAILNVSETHAAVLVYRAKKKLCSMLS
jgi:RNA polymerase sigma-70 factor, ECF subfamily